MIWSRQRVVEMNLEDLNKAPKEFWSFVRSHEALRQLFVEFGSHKENCKFVKNQDNQMSDNCTCGLVAELRRLSGK